MVLMLANASTYQRAECVQQTQKSHVFPLGAKPKHQREILLHPVFVIPSFQRH